MKLKSFLFASAAAMVSVAGAHAQNYEGLYGSIGAGLNSVAEDRDFESDLITGPSGLFPTPFDSEIDYDNGIAVVSALGYAWGNSWRTELEFAYRNNDARHIAPVVPGFSGFPEADLVGNLRSYALMANAIRDLDFLSRGFVTPYVGGGVGLALNDLNIVGDNPVAIDGFSPVTIDDSQISLAYQGIAGLSFAVAENLALDLSYRYYGTLKQNFEATFQGAATSIATTPNAHSLLASLRWNFGAPAAAAPAPVPVSYKDCWDGSSVPVSSSCPPEIEEQVDQTPDPLQVTVYFDYDKSNLTSEASSLIREAVSRARQFDVDAVRVVGNTDTSGSSAYNQALSERRARVVRDALVAQGVPAGIINSQSLGESNPARATDDGTREPLNRRTEITIMFE